ncbi:C-terminal domain phosphatase-like 4 [Rhynchospora pubera]|uniref:RNA polymerase II C-terminal domain phosphatase-like n=1 Tax=Rhynchospora pubera TaxID=906938 RepID=A0AAV8HKG7_9POAL|nr:C-terminal domain phosphatase-like 4 [Rhynchospora pubera]
MECIFLADERPKELKVSDDGNIKKCNNQFAGTQSNTEASVRPKIFHGTCVSYGQNVEDTIGYVSCKQFYENMLSGTIDTTGLLRLYLDEWMKTINKPKLVLDLDHTLMNSTQDLSRDEMHLLNAVSTTKDAGLLHKIRLEDCSMLVKLRPFVRQFLDEASKMFDLYVYTMGTRDYATQIVKLLDPENKYFISKSKVISREDFTKSGVKALDIVPGSKAYIIILDDKPSVWREADKINIIQIWRYNFFASSFPSSYSRFKSPAQMRIDEREADGTLALILYVLKQAHWRFLNMKRSGLQADFRRILKDMRSEILKGCVLAFTAGVPCSLIGLDKMPLWKVAEQLGAKYSNLDDASVTHVLAVQCSTQLRQWAHQNGKFLVHANWLEKAWHLWRRPREEQFMLLPLDCNPAALPAPTPSPTAVPAYQMGICDAGTNM